ncbi:S1C family serine protease [Sphingobium nicotianae]|uniref:S1C family serine protease n=1 Tax=Sphingobium nicotianae TaxID=2782607 RepID=A0A9X1DEL2_9SPHN|nr:trypsin-like peptidase domain-containing protein [Sphingobium nicotianae]MBT2188479.1 S1C family serine protease [Sphingobium nicotianae]
MISRLPGLFRPFAMVLLLLLALGLPVAAPADIQDIAATSRSVVRVALVATDGENAYFVGHGSGVVIAPGRILTNAHVVELTRSEPNIVIGVIPPEGKKSYGGKVIAYSPGNDLALIAIDGAQLPVATFYAGVPVDGQQVTAIGYPGSVDRAQGMGINDIIHPMTPVRTSGTVSSGRASKQFDTVLHTAELASGNSGGPLVDECGRVLGINSFGSLSDGNDATFGFAVSYREIASFLRQAGVQTARSNEPCRSMAEIDAAQRVADERARGEAAAQADRKAIAEREKAIEAREQAQQTVIARRENMMALAALFLALGAVAAGAAVLGQSKGAQDHARRYGIAAGVLLLAAVITFALRPGFDSAEEKAGDAANEASSNAAANGADAGQVSDRLCRIDNALSRVTVSDTTDVPFTWNEDGCLNGQTQFAKMQGVWSRVLVPAEEASISVRSFDPVIGRYRTDKYLVDADTADRARALREKIKWTGCTIDPDKLAQLASMQAEIQALLPAQPNERLVYHCEIGKGAPAAPAPQP